MRTYDRGVHRVDGNMEDAQNALAAAVAARTRLEFDGIDPDDGSFAAAVQAVTVARTRLLSLSQPGSRAAGSRGRTR